MSSFAVIEGAYWRDLLDQPKAIQDTLDGLGEPSEGVLGGRKFRRAVLTGMGSSYHGLHPLCLELNRHGVRSLMVETSELLYSMPEVLDPETLLVVVSQSGRSVEVVRLLERPGLPYTIGVTNTPDSPLTQKPNGLVLMRAGAEFSVSCKTYVATMVALQWLADVLCGKPSQLAGAAKACAAYLDGWRTHVETLAKELEGVRDLFIVGRGASLAAAGTGGLILKESTHLHAEGMSTPAFRHGPMEMLSREVFVLAFEGDAEVAPLNQRLVEDVLSAGGRAALVSPRAEKAVFRIPDVPAAVRPVLEILPVQMMSLALGLLTGREPGRFERASKVTIIE